MSKSKKTLPNHHTPHWNSFESEQAVASALNSLDASSTAGQLIGYMVACVRAFDENPKKSVHRSLFPPDEDGMTTPPSLADQEVRAYDESLQEIMTNLGAEILDGDSNQHIESTHYLIKRPMGMVRVTRSVIHLGEGFPDDVLKVGFVAVPIGFRG